MIEVRSESDRYCESFGYEWTKFSGDYLDNVWDYDKSRSYLEYYLGLPLTHLDGLRVLEVGSGTGRFSQVLVNYCKELVSVDLSSAVYVNKARDAANIRLIKEDFYNLEFEHEFDVVLCMGVLQHTSDPAAHLIRLFDYAKENGIVAFNVYAARPQKSWKYTLREIIPEYLTVQEFGSFLDQHIDTIASFIEETASKPKCRGKGKNKRLGLLRSILSAYKDGKPFQEQLVDLIALLRERPLLESNVSKSF